MFLTRGIQTGLLLRSAVRPLGGHRLAPWAAAYSTGAERKDPALVAESIISKLPGASTPAKTSTALIASSIAAYLISKEIYILDAEVFEVACMFGAYAIWYVNGKSSAIEYFTDRQNTIKNVLQKAREEHKEVVKERIEHISKINELVDVTKHLYSMSKEIAEMEAQVYELQQKASFTAEVKSTLDAWVRHEASVREQEQKRLVAEVMDKVAQELKDPKVQQAILNQAVADVEKIAAKA